VVVDLQVTSGSHYVKGVHMLGRRGSDLKLKVARCKRENSIGQQLNEKQVHTSIFTSVVLPSEGRLAMATEHELQRNSPVRKLSQVHRLKVHRLPVPCKH
jgi:hypothetical protein